VIRVQVELSDAGGNRSRLEVEAKSIERALEHVFASYPGWEARVVFPIDPEGYFVGDAAAMIRAEAAHRARERRLGVVRAPATTVTQAGRRHR
jgi:hypothetical protein